MREMRAIVIAAAGGPEVLQLRTVPAPEPGHGEIRVRVHAAGINRADLLQRRGLYPPPPGWPVDIPGLEYAGEVETVGGGVGAWRVGDRVMGLVGGGGYAEYVAVSEREALAVPENLSLAEAAAVPEVFITAHDALFTQLGLRAGERLLIHAVGSGVGTAALQLAKNVGATVLGTSRSAWKLERARELGLDVGIESSEEDVAQVVRRETDGAGVDAVLDLVGGPYLMASLESLAVKGRMIIVGLSAGRKAELDMGTVLRKRLQIMGTSLRSRSPEQKADAAGAFEAGVGELLASGQVRPVIDRIYPFGEVVDAHRRMESNANFGKLVITITPQHEEVGDLSLNV